MILDIDEFLKLNLKDEVFIIETDTVYGIGCLYNSIKGAKRILEIKNRPESKYFSLLVSNMDQVSMLTKDSDKYLDLTNKYWPGAVTFIYSKSDKVGQHITSNDTVGIRMPDSKKTLKIIEHFGPIIMTSLNKSGEPAITKFSDVIKYERVVDYIIKGDDLSGIPSTVYDLKNNKTLRVGSIIIK